MHASDQIVQINAKVATGLRAGTGILTTAGEIPIEDLRPGDRVICRNGGLTVLQAVMTQTTKCAPIKIRANSLGHTRPGRDIITAPGTRIYIRDWRAQALFGHPAVDVAAERLIDGEFVARLKEQTLTLHHLQFDGPRVIYADGLEVIAG